MAPDKNNEEKGTLNTPQNRVSPKDAQKAFKEAQKEQREKELANLKIIIKKTLEELSDTQRKRDDLNGRIALLKKDLEDLKEGRLDRMAERQKIDPAARAASVIVIEKAVPPAREIHHYHHDNTVFQPYPVWRVDPQPWWTPVPTIWCTTVGNSGTPPDSSPHVTFSNTFEPEDIKGTFLLNDGSIRHI